MLLTYLLMIMYRKLIRFLVRVHGSTVIENLQREVDRSTQEVLNIDRVILEQEVEDDGEQDVELSSKVDVGVVVDDEVIEDKQGEKLLTVDEVIEDEDPIGSSPPGLADDDIIDGSDGMNNDSSNNLARNEDLQVDDPPQKEVQDGDIGDNEVVEVVVEGSNPVDNQDDTTEISNKDNIYNEQDINDLHNLNSNDAEVEDLLQDHYHDEHANISRTQDINHDDSSHIDDSSNIDVDGDLLADNHVEEVHMALQENSLVEDSHQEENASQSEDYDDIEGHTSDGNEDSLTYAADQSIVDVDMSDSTSIEEW